MNLMYIRFFYISLDLIRMKSFTLDFIKYVQMDCCVTMHYNSCRSQNWLHALFDVWYVIGIDSFQKFKALLNFSLNFIFYWLIAVALFMFGAIWTVSHASLEKSCLTNKNTYVSEWHIFVININMHVIMLK